MKREIKFRAWNGHKVIYDFHIKNDWHYAMDNYSEGYGGFTIMQYTGLKDKNGTDIYEGDIVKIGYMEEENNCTTHEVEYCGYRDYPAFELKPYPEVDSNGLSWAKADADIIVIGNIYQDEHLLNKI